MSFFSTDYACLVLNLRKGKNVALSVKNEKRLLYLDSTTANNIVPEERTKMFEIVFLFLE